MGVIFVGLFWLASLVSLAASWAGMAYLIGPIIGTILIGVLLFLRMTWWVAPAAFLGAWQMWELPWYLAALIALPGIIIMVPMAAAIIGAGIIDRRRLRGIGQS